MKEVKITSDIQCPVTIFTQNIDHISSCWHQSIEIILILSGSSTITLKTNTYYMESGDILVINPYEFHELYGHQCTALCVQFHLSDFHLNSPHPESDGFYCNSCEHRKPDLFQPIKKLILQLAAERYKRNGSNTIGEFTITYQILNELMQNFRKDHFQTDAGFRQDYISDAVKYMMQHYSENLTLTSLAEYTGLNASYFSHLFKLNTGVSFYEQLTDIRLSHAVESLLYSDLSINDIAFRNGFSTPRAFTTQFRKKYGMLPSKYRTRNRQNIKTDPGNVALASDFSIENSISFSEIRKFAETQPLEDASSESGLSFCTLGNIPLSGKNKRLRHTHKKICSVGRARQILVPDIQKMLKTLQQEIGFEYIYFHGILGDELQVYREDSASVPSYNFYYCDIILDFLLSIGLRPVIEFSFMPSALASDPEQQIFTYPFCVSTPKSYQRWAELVTSFLEHLIERYTLSEVQKWQFCCWDELLAFHSSSKNRFADGFAFYECTYHAVKSVCENFLFSAMIDKDLAPASYTLYLLEHAREKQCVPDFIFAKFYPGSNQKRSHLRPDRYLLSNLAEGDYMYLNEQPNQLQEYLQNFRELDHYFSDFPVFLIEWNVSVSQREWLNDTCYSSCYIIHNICQNYDLAESFCYWSLSDWTEELPISPQLFHGGNGLFTQNGIKKPAYYAYYLLSKLEDYFVFQKDGCFITSNLEHTCFSVLLYNYSGYTQKIFDRNNFEISYQTRYSVFEKTNKKEFIFSLSDLPGGTYTIHDTIINRHAGSAFDTWERMGGVPLFSQESIENLKILSSPMHHYDIMTAEHSVLNLSRTLEPLEVRLVEIRLKN